MYWAHFLSLARSKLRLCSANHRPGYWSNLPCDWPSTVWAYSEQGTENGPWWDIVCLLWVQSLSNVASSLLLYMLYWIKYNVQWRESWKAGYVSVGNEISWTLIRKQMSLICSIQNSTCPSQFSASPAQYTLTLASRQVLLSLTVQ